MTCVMLLVILLNTKLKIPSSNINMEGILNVFFVFVKKYEKHFH